jgi:CubicO group peptidase (beta-lactamase class C family)
VTSFPRAAAVLRDAVAARAFPAAVVEVGRAEAPIWTESFGRLSYEPDAPMTTPGTVFDLASLTKVIVTTTLAMRAVDDGRLTLDASVGALLRSWRGQDREIVTLRDLLSHASGLTAYMPFYRDCTGRQEFEHAIAALPLEYPPRSRSLYSDLGFMLLGFILEDVRRKTGTLNGSGKANTETSSVPVFPWDPATALAPQFHRLATYVTSEPLTFHPPRSWRSVTAPTEMDPWRGRLLVGEVHDENTWALGGAAGHAGLFGTAPAVGAFARAMLLTIGGRDILAKTTTAREFIRRTDVPGSSRALGWDTMLPTASCGMHLSPASIGHTGFTGTSLWIDWERDLYIVLLTNRVHPTRENEAIRTVRPAFHDAVMEDLQD